MRTKSLSLDKEHSSEQVFLIIKLSSDDINHINFDLFGRLLKFVFTFTFLIFLIIWVLLFSKTGHWRRKWVSSSTPVLHNLQILSSVFTPIYLPFSISRFTTTYKWMGMSNFKIIYKVINIQIEQSGLRTSTCFTSQVNVKSWLMPFWNLILHLQ